jgi:hypothetical protein
LLKVRKEKDDLSDLKDREKEKYEKTIKELEERCKLLMAESGDQVGLLEKRIKQMIEDYELEKENMLRQSLREKEDLTQDFKN